MHDLLIKSFEPCNFGNDWGLYVDIENIKNMNSNFYNDINKEKNNINNFRIIDCLKFNNISCCNYNYNEYFEERFDDYHYYLNKNDDSIDKQQKINITDNKYKIHNRLKTYYLLKYAPTAIMSSLLTYIIFCLL